MRCQLNFILAAASVIALGVCASPGVAHAQDSDKSSSDSKGGKGGKKSDESRPYEAVHIIQQVPFAKEDRLEIALVGGTAINPRFRSHAVGGLSLVYHIKEAFGIELNLSYADSSKTELNEEIREKINAAPKSPDVSMTLHGNVGIQITPIYGKFEIFGVLTYFDFFVATGIGFALTELRPFNSRQSAEDKVQLLGSASFGFRVFPTNLFGWKNNKWVGFRIEMRDYIFSERERADISGVFNNFFFMGGLNVYLPPF